MVLGAKGRNTLGVRLGSTVHGVLHHADGNVVVVHPKGVHGARRDADGQIVIEQLRTAPERRSRRSASSPGTSKTSESTSRAVSSTTGNDG